MFTWMKKIMKHKQVLELKKRDRSAYKAPNLHLLQPTTDSWAMLGKSQVQRKEAKGGDTLPIPTERSHG